ncbi:hypothetical protein SKAU_G00192360 [Synaphobranchus kaupii]|uniref:Uncharacterized protein n=1 Tax=Synaphobranchus kaupii TaxID=118154 RepID=A0A9Q1FDW5_SYNKA|nr:hypothetical protein SKAU_G00192360 [Synaphobranchus kaupii]
MGMAFQAGAREGDVTWLGSVRSHANVPISAGQLPALALTPLSSRGRMKHFRCRSPRTRSTLSASRWCCRGTGGPDDVLIPDLCVLIWDDPDSLGVSCANQPGTIARKGTAPSSPITLQPSLMWARPPEGWG